MAWFIGLGVLFVLAVVVLMFLIAITANEFDLESPYMSAKDLWADNKDDNIDG